MKNLYITLQFLNENLLNKLNKKTHELYYNKNNDITAIKIINKFIDNKIIKKDIRALKPCYTSSSYIEGFYFPSNEIKIKNDLYKFVCVASSGLVLSLNNCYFYTELKEIDLKKTLIMEGRGADRNSETAFKNYRYLIEVTPGAPLEQANPFTKENEKINKICFEIHGGAPYGYFRKNNKYIRVENKQNNNYYLSFNCSAYSKNNCFGFGFHDMHNIFKTYEYYINALNLESIKIKNGKKFAEEEKRPYNNFIAFTEENLLKIINHLCKTNFKNVLNYCVCVCDLDFNTFQTIYN